MSRYNQASHVFWRCQYHIVWTPKYRFRILKNNIGKEVYRCIYVYCNQLGCEVVELNVQVDHVVNTCSSMTGLFFRLFMFRISTSDSMKQHVNYNCIFDIQCCVVAFTYFNDHIFRVPFSERSSPLSHND